MWFSRQEYWSRLPFPPPGDLPNSGIEPAFPASAGRFFTAEPPRQMETLIQSPYEESLSWRYDICQKGLHSEVEGRNCVTWEKDAELDSARDGQAVWPWPCHLYSVSSTIAPVGAKSLTVESAENWEVLRALGLHPRSFPSPRQLSVSCNSCEKLKKGLSTIPSISLGVS